MATGPGGSGLHQHLSERIRLLQSPDYQKEQAEAAAAEAAKVGEQLLADPPPPKYNLAKIHARLVRLRRTEFAPFTPIFDLPTAQAKLARKRFRMPIPPDDPAHPERLLRRLKSTAAGCEWLLDRWAELRAALEHYAGWQPEERLRAVRLLAKLPADAVNDPTVRSIYFSCVILGGKDALVFADQVREMADVEFTYFVERMAGRGLTGQAPPSREAARDCLLAMVDGVMVGLQARAAMHAEREEAELSSDRLAFDPSPAGRRLLRLQSRLFGSLIRTINRLTEARRRPDAQFARPQPADAVTANRFGPGNYEKIRNEANAEPPSVPVASISTSISVGASGEPAVATGQPTTCHRLPPMAGVQPAKYDQIVSLTALQRTTCVSVRNEPNQESRSFERTPQAADVQEPPSVLRAVQSPWEIPSSREAVLHLSGSREVETGLPAGPDDPTDVDDETVSWGRRSSESGPRTRGGPFLSDVHCP